MAVYIGNCAYEETTGSVLTVDPWGMDSLNRQIIGRSDQLPEYIATLGRSRTIRDSVFSSLFLTDYNITNNGALSKASLTYKGIIGATATNAALPPPVYSGGYKTQSVTIPFIGDIEGESTGISCDFEYIAPFTRTMYVTNTRPLTPRRGVLFTGLNAFAIVSQNGSPGNLRIFAGKSFDTQDNGSSITLGGSLQAFNAVAEAFVTQFDWKQVGQWWEVEETVEARLIQLNLANIGAIF